MQARFRTAATFGCLATCVLVTLGLGGPAAAAEGEDVLQLTALTGPAGGDLTITVPASAGGSDVDTFEHVQIQLIAPAESDEKPNRIINLKAVDARRGSATIDLGPLERGTAVDVQLHVRELKPPRTRILRGDGIAKLRPDLVVAAVHAPEQTLSTRPIDVVADIDELNADTGANATLTLMLGPTPLAEPKTITIGAGGTRTVIFEGVKLTAAMTAELTVRVEDAAPYETDATNNARSRTVEVTEHELVRANVLVHALGGYGAQFNKHVYAPDHAQAAGAPAGPRGEGEGARAAARPDLLQRRTRGARRRISCGTWRRSSRPSARPGGRRDDQHHLPDGGRIARLKPGRGHGDVRQTCSRTWSKVRRLRRTSAG